MQVWGGCGLRAESWGTRQHYVYVYGELTG